MLSRQTKVLVFVGIACLASALIWQNYSHWAFLLTHGTREVKTETNEGVGWDPSALWVHQPPGSDFLLLVGTLALLFTVPSLISDIKQSRQRG
jgi:hypothetical protein